MIVRIKLSEILIKLSFLSNWKTRKWPKLLTIIGMGSAITSTPVIQQVAPTNFPRPVFDILEVEIDLFKFR